MTREDVYDKCTYAFPGDGRFVVAKWLLPQEAIDAIIDCAVEEAVDAVIAIMKVKESERKITQGDEDGEQ